MSQNVTVCVSSVYEMEIENGVFEDVETACVALVPVAQTAYRAAKISVTRPNANFVTQLIATAEHVPQTCELRRAAPADALSAYSAHLHPIRDAGLRTRQII
jgi:spore maturation protein SpmA